MHHPEFSPCSRLVTLMLAATLGSAFHAAQVQTPPAVPVQPAGSPLDDVVERQGPFVLAGQTFTIAKRYALRMSGGHETPGYLLGFEFAEAQRDQAAITALIARATRAAG